MTWLRAIPKAVSLNQSFKSSQCRLQFLCHPHFLDDLSCILRDRAIFFLRFELWYSQFALSLCYRLPQTVGFDATVHKLLLILFTKLTNKRIIPSTVSYTISILILTYVMIFQRKGPIFSNLLSFCSALLTQPLCKSAFSSHVLGMMSTIWNWSVLFLPSRLSYTNTCIGFIHIFLFSCFR